jgi:ribosomal protein S19
MRKFKKALAFNTKDRMSLIGPFFLGKRIRVYTGSKFVSFIIRKNMFGKRLGDFSFTKVMGLYIYYSKLRKKKEKMKKKNKKKNLVNFLWVI